MPGILDPMTLSPCHHPRAASGSIRTARMCASGISSRLLNAQSLSSPSTSKCTRSPSIEIRTIVFPYQGEGRGDTSTKLKRRAVGFAARRSELYPADSLTATAYIERFDESIVGESEQFQLRIADMAVVRSSQ